MPNNLPARTPEGLPCITREVIETFYHDDLSSKLSSEQRMAKVLSPIAQNNVELYKWTLEMYESIKKESGEPMARGFMSGVMHTYDLLRRQGEVLTLERR